MNRCITSGIEAYLKEQSLSLSTEDLKTFLNDPDQIETRTIFDGKVLTGEHSLHYSEYLYKNHLTEEQKKHIFSSGYELGHPGKIPSQSEADLFQYLTETYGGDDVEGLVKHIKKHVSKLVGIPFKRLIKDDRSTAYKVLTLFYRISRNHKKQLFTFIEKRCENKAEFELRSSYPYEAEKNSSKREKAYLNTAILAELLCNLAYGMSEDELKIARRINTELAEAGLNMAPYIRTEVIGEEKKIP
ncbi:hypothetical protein [Halodesulfovibrio sp.]|jgi:hypothetical protein|uniref:hypothetical protein n=1 Tax=Halodesulfovibrio sp. TaxID=1912772 RepID=UPI0025EE6CB9|nr:hypothetical protein [Halodesulfovibrio sp.]MCT4628030.1 hypothetical protein [Halodesulfovibrio sp.]